MTESIRATYKIKYDCKGSRRYGCTDDDFPINDVYVKRPWSNEVKEFELVIVPKE